MNNDMEEGEKLLSEDYDNLDPESGPPMVASKGDKKSRSSKSPKANKSPPDGPFERLLYICPSRWMIVFIIALFVLLYLFTNIQVSFLDKQRWVPRLGSKYMRGHDQPTIPNEVLQNYDQQFDQHILAPFKDMLNKLKNKISGNKDIGAILPERVQLNDSQTMSLVEEESNMAALYYDKWRKSGFGAHAKKYPTVTYCAQVNMISPHLVRQNNIYWQVVESKQPDLTLYLYNAYYDNRLWGKPAVKLITTTDRQVNVEKRSWWCLLWFDNLADPVLSTVTNVYTVWPEYWDFGVRDGIYGPQIMTCAIPTEYASEIPQAVSIQSVGECNKIDSQPSNVLRVIHNKPKEKSNSKKPSIGVCVQAFRFGTYDVSVRLVEWLEMVRLMGGEKVYFYVYGATGNMLKVLKHYEKEGLVDWRKLTMPGEQVNVPSLYNYFASQLGGKFWPQELLELNDCIYRNIHRHQFVGIFDIDEMIMPQTLTNWHELIAKIESGLTEAQLKTKAYYLNRHAYVYEMFEETEIEPSKKAIPDYLYMMRHTYRAELLGSGENIKCLHRTDLVTAVHNHFPMQCINTTGHHSCDGLVIDPADSILMHYRRNRSPPENCKTPDTPIKCTIQDRKAWRFFDALAEPVKTQLFAIFGDSNSRK